TLMDVIVLHQKNIPAHAKFCQSLSKKLRNENVENWGFPLMPILSINIFLAMFLFFIHFFKKNQNLDPKKSNELENKVHYINNTIVKAMNRTKTFLNMGIATQTRMNNSWKKWHTDSKWCFFTWQQQKKEIIIVDGLISVGDLKN
ncbi:hypothetical protein ACJX0J_008444, partial [Zea mays]